MTLLSVAVAMLGVLLEAPLPVALVANDAPGIVSGRAYQERARPTAADLPLPGVEVMVVPRSDAFLERLESIKAHARDSLQNYETAATELQLARDAYERELQASGRAGTVFKTAVKPDGTFSVANVPLGSWTIIGVKSVVLRQDRNLERKLDKDASTFIPVPRLKAVRDLTMWVKDLTVASGEPVIVELTDRNLWFSGVLEERKMLRPAPPKSGGHKR